MDDHANPAARPDRANQAPATSPEAELIPRLPAVVYVAEPGRAGRWRYVSPQIEDLLGYSPEEWCADPELWYHRIHPADRDRVVAEEDRDAERGAPLVSEYRMVARDGREIWVRDEAVLRDRPEGPVYDGLLTDITERKRAERELRFLADHDELTGLFNRRRFLAELDAELRRRRRFARPSSLVMLDLDNFKLLNDALGHRGGDDFLRVVANVLRGRIREADTAARIGGDEFVVLLRGASEREARLIAEELTDAIRARARLLAPDLPGVGASAGVAELRPAQQGTDDALESADRGLYEAKRDRGAPEGAPRNAQTRVSG